ncbi:substrate-binding periplasmic protein [Burkholderiaceae bacterium UC74_6]
MTAKARRGFWRRHGWPVCALWLAALGAAARADEFTVGVEEVDYAPIMSVVDGRYDGYAFELLEMFARSQGHRFTYRPLPVKRLVPYLVDGGIDLAFPDNPNWRGDVKRGHQLHYSEPMVPFQDVVFVRPERVGLPLKHLGVVRGFTPKRFQQQVDAGNLVVIEATAPSNLIQMTLSGRVDGVALAAPVGRYQLHQIGRDQALQPAPGLSGRFELHYRLSTLRHPKLIEQFNDFLKAEAAAILALQKRYGL